MSTIETPLSRPASDFGFLSGLIPNRDRGRFLRAVVLLFLAFSSIGYFLLLTELFAEFQARHNWPIARGEVVSCEGKTGERVSRRRTVYWMECEVRFDVPADECLTGTTAADTQERYPCYGMVRSPSTTSWEVTNGWTNPQFLSTPKRILHDPHGPEVKLADESAWLAYRLPNVLMMSAWMIVCLLFLAMIHWRVQVIEKSILSRQMATFESKQE
jgi:hypothetical protein